MGKESTAVCTRCGGFLKYDVLDSEWRCCNCGRTAWPEQEGPAATQGPREERTAPPGQTTAEEETRTLAPTGQQPEAKGEPGTPPEPELPPVPAPAGRTPAEWLGEARWPRGRNCPRCGNTKVSEREAGATMPYRCKECQKTFSVRTGTVLAKRKVPYRAWLEALRLYFSQPETHPDTWRSLLPVRGESANVMYELINTAFHKGDDEIVNRMAVLADGGLDWEDLMTSLENPGSEREDSREDSPLEGEETSPDPEPRPDPGPVLAPDPTLARNDLERWLEEVRWPHGKHCRSGGSAEVGERQTRAHAPYRCQPCKKTFSAWIGTVLGESKLYNRTWLIAFRLYFSHPEAGPDSWPSLMAITPEAAATAHGLISNAIRTGEDELVNRITALVNRGQIDWEELTKHMDSTRSDNRGEQQGEAAGAPDSGQAPGVAGVLEGPAEAGLDEAPERPEATGLDKAPERPEAAGVDEAPEGPETAGLDGAPEVPATASRDEAPEVKGQPEATKGTASDGLDEAPEVNGQPEAIKGPDTVRLDETPEKPEAAGLDGTLDEVQKGTIALRFLEDLGQELRQNMDELSRRLESVQGATTEIRRNLAGQPDRP